MMQEQELDRTKRVTINICDKYFSIAVQNRVAIEAPILDRSYHRSTTKPANHVAENRGEHVGRSHVDCLDDDEGSKLEREREYLRPSHMFHWLRAADWGLEDAHKVFGEYKGKESYSLLQLEPPEPRHTEGEYTDYSSHMSDYDEMGLSPISQLDNQGDDEQHLVDHNGRQTSLEFKDQVWSPTGQIHQISAWSDNSHIKDIDCDIACMTPGKSCMRKRRTLDDSDSETEDEGTTMVCDMNGQSWGNLLFPIISDSGTCASVMPTSWRHHVPLRETPQSKAGDYYRAANGNTIYQEGERTVSIMTQEGSLRDMRFIVCDVAKALGSVSQMCRIGHRVVFNPFWSHKGSYIEQVETVERMRLQEEGGLYVLKTKVAPRNKQFEIRRDEGFVGQVIHP